MKGFAAYKAVHLKSCIGYIAFFNDYTSAVTVKAHSH